MAASSSKVLSWLLILVLYVYALATPECNLFYGLLDAQACENLLMEYPTAGNMGGFAWVDGRRHYFSFQYTDRPPGLRPGQWELRRSLPIFASNRKWAVLKFRLCLGLRIT